MYKATIVILTTLAILLLPGLVFCIQDGKSEEELFWGDSTSHELTITASEQHILDATLNYYWAGDQTDYATGTWQTKMQAHVN